MKKLGFLFVFAFLTSCKETQSIPIGNAIYFENPQPINDAELKSFPNTFLGMYIYQDSSYLNIQKDMITDERIWKSKISYRELDSVISDYELSDKEMVSKDGSWKFQYRKLKDSVELTNRRVDTLFIFSNFQKAKRINGNLVISKKDSIFWNIKLYTFDKEKLTVKQLYSDTDLKKMDSITKVKAKMLDSSTYIITPSRAEFKQFFKLKDFGYDTHYKKVKE